MELRAHARRLAIERRAALTGAQRAAHTAALVQHLSALLARIAPRTLAFYWPIRGEIDLRPFVADWLAADAARCAALPVVTTRAAPLTFHRWQPDTPMRTGDYGIAIPAHAQPCTPDVLLVPMNAFDAHGTRIGYGGGYYDRTLAALPAATAIGIAFELARVEDAHACPHDVPMHWLVTEAGAFAAAPR